MQDELQHIKQQFRIIGNSATLHRAIQVAIQVAPTEMTVLITGESGSGKESFSKIIHNLGLRKHGNFIAINCSAIPEGTIDSELFGHEKGSFTGALDTRKGYFESADGGTIFLDEVGEMPLSTQSRLLRVLEYGEFVKVGASKIRKTDVRIVAATNVNLENAIERGKFREDLYYRLNTVPIHIPPLRDRGTDIMLLFHKFASDFASQYRVKPIQLTAGAKEALLKYKFPGNIRQLKNLVKQMSILEGEVIISKEQLIRYLPQKTSGLPVLYNAIAKNNTYEQEEKEMLYKLFFDMKQDIHELKKLVFKLLRNNTESTQIIKESPLLFDRKEGLKVPSEPVHLLGKPTAILENKSTTQSPPTTLDPSQEEDLSIAKKEKELIQKALKKYHGNRKYTAEGLGISERTLYRKIKQYELTYTTF